MAKKSKMIPFSWLPSAWGLAGKMRDIAEAEYTLDGEELERRMLEINLAGKTEKELALAALELDKKYGKVDSNEYENKKATIKDEPYVRVARIVTDPTNPAYGGIILDWNKEFVVHLESHGYGPHPTEEETVNEWFNELCKNVALEAFDGEGDFSEKVPGEALVRRRTNPDVIKRQ